MSTVGNERLSGVGALREGAAEGSAWSSGRALGRWRAAVWFAGLWIPCADLMERARTGRANGAEGEAAAEVASGAACAPAARSVGRVVELVLMFVVGPVLLSLVIQPFLVFAGIWLLAGVTLTMLMKDRTFDRRRLWDWAAAGREMPRVLVRWAVLTIVFVAGMAAWEPERLWSLPRDFPGRWAVIMVGYPIISVWAQEIGFRAFFFHRYGCLFRSRWGLVAASAAVFGLAHVVMHNAFAVVLSTMGGVVFADTYLRSKSLAAVIVEHALYGCMLFTVGWGWYFVAGVAR